MSAHFGYDYIKPRPRRRDRSRAERRADLRFNLTIGAVLTVCIIALAITEGWLNW